MSEGHRADGVHDKSLCLAAALPSCRSLIFQMRSSSTSVVVSRGRFLFFDLVTESVDERFFDTGRAELRCDLLMREPHRVETRSFLNRFRRGGGRVSLLARIWICHGGLVSCSRQRRA